MHIHYLFSFWEYYSIPRAISQYKMCLFAPFCQKCTETGGKKDAIWLFFAAGIWYSSGRKGGGVMEKRPRPGRRVWLLPAAAMLLGAAWFENFTLSCTALTARSRALPPAFDGLRIVQLSDLHGREFGVQSQRLLARVRAQEPDLIALTGDLADEYTDVSMLRPLLEGLTALAPVFYVTGNHEWVLARRERQALFDLLDETGVVRLQNEYRRLQKNGASIAVAGVDDRNGPYDKKTPQQLVREIRAAEGEDAYILMLSHRNDELTQWTQLGVQTVLCGHGHGGIVRLPVLGGVFGTHHDLFPDEDAGLYTAGETSMVVSRGLGGSRKLPLRIGNRPEIVTVVLKTESGNI